MKIDIDYIKAQLARRASERQLAKVARMSGVSPTMLRRIMNGDSRCAIGTVERLQDFLTRHEKVKKLVEGEEE
jgi:DNA-binding phage protein